MRIAALALFALCLPLHAYDVKAVYADYLAATALYKAQELEKEETAWVQTFTALSTLSSAEEKAEIVEIALLPRAQKLAKAARDIKALFKTKEAAQGLGVGLDILILCDTLSIQLLAALRDPSQEALAGAAQTVAEITALEGRRQETVDAFLKKLRQKMKKAKMPSRAIEAVK